MKHLVCVGGGRFHLPIHTVWSGTGTVGCEVFDYIAVAVRKQRETDVRREAGLTPSVTNFLKLDLTS